MASFSWSDTLHAAIDPCLSCLRRDGSSSSADEPRNRFDDLERLLAEPSTSTPSLDADSLSLHSNPGHRRRPRAGPPARRISLFGLHLFGRAPAPVRLDGPDDLAPSRPVLSGPSSTTFDSDAAPLDAAAIEARALEEAERAARRARRRARKEMRAAALALALNAGAPNGDGEGDFEGFQGSGGTTPYTAAPFLRSDAGSSSGGSSSQRAENMHDGAEEDDDDDEMDGGDLDARAYTRRAPRGSSAGGGGGSDSRSRTSASYSAGQPSSLPLPSPLSYAQQPQLPLFPKQKSKSKSKKGASPLASAASSSAASASLASPAAPAFPALEPHVVEHGEGEGFEGFPGDDLLALSAKGMPSAGLGSGMPSAGLRREGAGAGGFPSAGFGGRGPRKSDLGTFLAAK